MNNRIVTSEEYEDAPPPYSAEFATNQLLTETQSHDGEGTMLATLKEYNL